MEKLVKNPETLERANESHQTEDMGEDEDGVPIPYCPHDKSRGNPKGIEDEQLPGELDLTAELFLQNFSLKSEEITSLVPEKPPISESDDENNNSDDDLSTYMVKASNSCQQLLSCDNSPESLLDRQVLSWAEDLSEEEELSLTFSVTDRKAKMQNCTGLVESDMEEFEERDEPKTNYFKEFNFFSENKQKNKEKKNFLNNEESSHKENIEIICNDEEFNNIAALRGEKSGEKENSSLLKTAFENDIQERETSEQNSDSECCSRVFHDQEIIKSLLNEAIEQIVKDDVLKLPKLDNELHRISESHFPEENSKLKSQTVERHLLKNTTLVKETDGAHAEPNIIRDKERYYGKPDGCEPTHKFYNDTETSAQDAWVRLKVSRGPGAERKEEMKKNFTLDEEMWPNSESDLTEENSELKSDSTAADRNLLKHITQLKKMDVQAEPNIIWGKGRYYEKLSVRSEVSRGPGAERKEEMKGKFTMDEEIGPNSESDLAEEKSELKSDSTVADGNLSNDITHVKKTDDSQAEPNIIWIKERYGKIPENNAHTYKDYVNTENSAQDPSVRFKASREPDALRKEEMMDNFTLEPISSYSENQAKMAKSQSDSEDESHLKSLSSFSDDSFENSVKGSPKLSTMSKKYCDIQEKTSEARAPTTASYSFQPLIAEDQSEGESHLDSLSSSSDDSLENSVKGSPKLPTMPKKYCDIQDKTSEAQTPTTASDSFKPPTVEDQGTEKPQNKFSKFFKSFKKRLSKKP